MTSYPSEIFFESDIIVKQEPDSAEDGPNNPNNSLSASVPIPTRRPDSSFLIRDFSSNGLGGGGGGLLDFGSSSPFHDLGLSTFSTVTSMDNIGGGSGSNTMWTTRISDLDTDYALKTDPLMRMDEDDIFQVDKADLIQGPTLAELNANDENLLEDLNFDDLLLPGDGSYSYADKLTLLNPQLNNNSTGIASSCPQVGSGFLRDSLESTASIPSSPFNAFSSKVATPAFSPASQDSSTSSLLRSTTSPSLPPTGLPPQPQQKHSALHELLMKRDNYMSSPDRNLLGQSVPRQSLSPVLGNASMRAQRSPQQQQPQGKLALSSSAPTHLGLDQIWARREPRKHLLSTGSLVEAGSTSSLSTGGVLSPEAHDFSNDDDIDSEEDSEHYEDFSSDENSDNENDRSFKISSSKRERFFWQYNVQAKGPKGQRLIMKTRMEDPHVLNEVTDPVFSPNCSVRGIKHSGKARKGDGNDLTPNPRKLFVIGLELNKLSSLINSMTPVSELPFNIRPKSRKEKNKLASRACRLKKKAQHEANKIKLQGLESEHKKMLNALIQAKETIALKVTRDRSNSQDHLTNHIESILQTVSSKSSMIAGNTTEYVNSVLDKVKGNKGTVRINDL